MIRFINKLTQGWVVMKNFKTLFILLVASLAMLLTCSQAAGRLQEGDTEKDKSSSSNIKIKDNKNKSNIRKNAKDNQALQKISAIISAGVGAYMIKVGKPMTASAEPSTQSMGVLLMAQGAQAILQAGMLLNTADASGNTANRVSYDGDFPTYDPNPNNGDGSGGPAIPTASVNQIKEAKKQLKALEKAGYTVNPDGSLTFPDGTSVAASEVRADGPAGDKLGLSDDNRQKAKSILDKALKKAKDRAQVLAIGTEGGGGRGIGGGAGGYSDDDDSSFFNRRGMKKNKKKTRKVSSVAGMHLMHNGAKIGVPGDNIFEMMKRRYQLKKKQASFIE